VARLIALLAAVALGTLAAAGELRTATLDVKGMTCAACPITVKRVLKRVPGVADAAVDLKTGTAEVRFDPDQVQPDALAKAVTGAGFPAAVRR
jgi:mercuric transport protein